MDSKAGPLVSTEASPLNGKTRQSSGFWARLTACVLAVADGYDMGCISGVAVVLQEKWLLSTWKLSCLIGVAYFAISFGAIGGGWLADSRGRRFAMGVAFMLLIVGSLMMALATCYHQLFLGRILDAFGIGAGLSVVTTYMAEVAPAGKRGQFPSLLEVAIVAGVTLGYMSDVVCFGMKDDWRWIIGVGGVLPAICMAFLAFGFLPESPRFLHMQGEHTEAETALRQFASEDEVVETMRKWKEEVTEAAEAASYIEAVLPPHAAQRRAFLASVGVVILQALSGITPVTVYSSFVLSQDLGIGESRAFAITWSLGIIRVLVAAVSGLYLIDRYGRRRLLLVSSIGVVASYVSLFVAYSGPFRNPVFLKCIGLAGFAVFYSVGLGPVMYVYASEVVETRVRSKTISVALWLARLYVGILMTVFPMMLEMAGMGGITMTFLIQNLCGLIFIFYFVPETKGVALEDMHLLFS